MATTIIRALHPKSQLADRPELDFFSAPLTDASIQHTTYEAIYPTFPLSNDEAQTITLLVPRDPVNYIDLTRSYLEIRLHGEGADVNVQPNAAEERDAEAFRLVDRLSAWTVVNNIGASLFETVKVSVNDHSLFHSSNYPYQAILTKLLNVSSDNRNSVQRLAWFTSEEQTKWEQWGFGREPALLHRLEATNAGQIMTVYDRLYIPIAYAYKLLPNNVAIKLDLFQARNSFTINAANIDVTWRQGPRAVPDLKLKIDTIVWHVCKVRPYDHVLDSNNRRLINEAALFFFPRRDLRVFIITASSQSFHQLIYSGRKPHSLTIGMVTDNAAIGDYFANPFNFQPFGLKRCTLSINNLLPTTPLEFDFGAQVHRWEAGYRLLSEATGHSAEFGEGPLITPELYRDGNFILHYSLTNNLSNDTFLESAEAANIHLTMEFARNPNLPIRLFVLARLDDYVECIGPERRFIPSFAAMQ